MTDPLLPRSWRLPRRHRATRLRRARRWPSLLVASALLSGLGVALVSAQAEFAGAAPRAAVLSSAVAQSQTTTTVVLGTPHIIPQPNSGRAPRDAGERGGWMQEALFGLLCGVLVLIGLLIWRDSRRKRRALARAGQGEPVTSDR